MVASVREKRGAGAGCTTPSRSTKVPRLRRCGWSGASAYATTGPTQASEPVEDLEPRGLGALPERLGEHLADPREARRVVAVGQRVVEAEAGERARRRTAAPAAPTSGAGRRRSRRGRRTAPRRRGARCGARGPARPVATRLAAIALRWAVPSTIAASTTWPWPDVRASSRAASTPMTRYVEPPPKSPSRLLGKCGRAAVLAQAVQGAGDADVVEVVAGRLGQRPGLSPAGHPAVDQPRVAGPAVLGAEPETLGGAGAQALDQRRRRARPGRGPGRVRRGCLRSTATLGRPRVSTSCVAVAERAAARAARAGSRRRRGRPGSCRRAGPGPIPAISTTLSRAAVRCPGRARSHGGILAAVRRAAPGAGTAGSAPRAAR